VSKSYGLKQGAIAGTYVSTRNTRMAAPIVSRKYTHTYTCMAREIPVTLREYEYLKIRELRGRVSYVWRDAAGKLEVQ
jgi:hypothetical protein